MKKRAQLIQHILQEHFPETPVPLKHKDPFTLLIAVLLSAQCTDERVNQVTPALFKRASTPKQMAALSSDTILSYIRSCGLGPTKAHAIQKLSQKLLDCYQGQVPQTLKELKTLPGVGQKTASVVLTQAFNIPAFPVDTHIHRCSCRWGLTSGKSVEDTEKILKKLFPKSTWCKLHLQIIYFARKYCPAKKHDPTICPICRRLADYKMEGR